MGRKRKPLLQLDPNDTTIAAKKTKSTEDDETSTTTRRAGTLLRMVLKNFMCHSLLDVDLSSNKNVLIGRNGSGKSAILTALIVGLGGKASLTNRGNSIKNFVKAGKNSGSVEIQIHNAGSMAYKPKLYGNKIVICRNLSASGGGTYRICSESGEVIASHLQEVLNITSSLNIQVDNPICILNQDTSRTFLNSSDPKKKFDLFVKATRLEDLEEQFHKIKLNKIKSQRLWEDKNVVFEKLSEESKTLEMQIKAQKSIFTLANKVKEHHLELLWAKVRDCENDLKKAQNDVEKAQNKHEQLLRDCSTRTDTITSIKERIESLNQQIHELKETIQVQSRPQLDVKKVIEDLRNKYNEKRRQKHQVVTTLQSKTKDSQLLENEIANATENMTRVEQEKMKRLRDLNTINEKIKAMEEHLQTCRNDLFQISSDIQTKEQDQHGLRREISNLDTQINQDQRNLNALKNESGNALLLYGRDMPQVKKMIEENKHRFKHVPKGPIGSFIKLKNKKWAVAVESHLQGLLGSFAVDNQKDSQILQGIFQRTWSGGRKPSIITSKFIFQKHNVRNNLVQAPADCVGLYDAIEIADPVISNCIVDQKAIEGILLMPNNERAIELMSNQATVPQNCHQGITVEGDVYYPSPNYRTYGSRYHQPKFLQVDTKQHILQLEHNMKKLQQKRENVQNQLTALNKEIKEQRTKKTELEIKIGKLDSAKSQVRRQLEQLKATAEPEVANVDLLESELNEIRNILRDKEAERTRIDEALSEIKDAITEKEQNLKELQEANSSLEDRMRALESQIREETTKQKEVSTSREFDKNRLKDLESRVNQSKTVSAEIESTLQRYVEQAARVGERPSRLRKVDDIAEEIAALERNVNKMKANTGNFEKMTEKYQSLQEKMAVTAQVLENLRANVTELTAASERRRRHLEMTKSYFVALIRRAFKGFLENREFEGSVEVNFPEKKLDLKVVPVKGTNTTTTSNLSGGERSFSTVGFLHALWQCMDFPFYFLDEFDVFMDKMNRSIVFEILLSHAEAHPDLQFVFLTPQDVSFLQNVNIMRLADPERMPV